MNAKYVRFLAVYQQTSGEAWASVRDLLPAVDAAILVELKSGATSDEVEERLGFKHQTVSAQIRHMAEAGLVCDSGEKRPTRSGRGAIVWVVQPPRVYAAPGQLGLWA